VSRDSGRVLIVRPARLSCRPHVAPACRPSYGLVGLPFTGLPLLLHPLGGAQWTGLRLSRRVSAELALSAILCSTCGALVGTRSMPDSNLWWLPRCHGTAARASDARLPHRGDAQYVPLCGVRASSPNTISAAHRNERSLPRCCGAGQYSTPSWFHAVAMIWSMPLSVVLARLLLAAISAAQRSNARSAPLWWRLCVFSPRYNGCAPERCTAVQQCGGAGGPSIDTVAALQHKDVSHSVVAPTRIPRCTASGRSDPTLQRRHV
jgi:hypothetical protein